MQGRLAANSVQLTHRAESRGGTFDAETTVAGAILDRFGRPCKAVRVRTLRCEAVIGQSAGFVAVDAALWMGLWQTPSGSGCAWLTRGGGGD